MNKKLLTLLVLGASFLTLSTFSTFAEKAEYNNININNTKLTFEGNFHFQTGIVNQNKLKAEEKFISPERKQFAFNTNAAFRVRFSQELENFTYGGMLVLTPTTQLNTAGSCNGSHLFVETEYGKIEAGSQGDAGYKLRITGRDVVAGSGDWSKYAKLRVKALKFQNITPEFLTGGRYFISSYKTEMSQFIDGTELPRKISYFTPLIHGLQFGISYIPDSSNTGGAAFDKKTNTGIKKYKIPKSNKTMVINTNVKDAVSLGAGYDHNISEGIDLSLALTGEIAKASGNAVLYENEEDKEKRKPIASYNIKNLRTYNIGGTFSYENFAYGLSYGTLNKSLTTPEYNKTGRDTKYYNTAIAYSQGHFKTSIEYFRSIQFKNNLDAVTLAGEYRAVPGLMPYAELTHFRAKGRPSYYKEAPKTKVSGNVFIVGAKLRLKL